MNGDRDTENLGAIIDYALISRTEVGCDMEPANVVDGLYELVRALDRLRNTQEDALEAHRHAMLDRATMLASALSDLAEAIRESKA